MNISKSLALCFLTTVSALAQQVPQFPWEEQAAPKPSEPSTSVSLEATANSSSSEIVAISPPPALSSSSVAETTTPASEDKPIFDSVRGNAYNPFSTVGAASTVRDLVTTPSDINGQRFLYVSPTAADRSGYLAFGLGSGSALLGLDNSPLGSPSALILGYANSSFGFALNYSVAKNWSSNSNTDVSTRTTYSGDNIGLYFSMPSGLYANVSWLTYAESYARDNDGNESSEDYSEIQANVGLTGKSGSLNYDGYLNIIRTGGTQTMPNDDKLADENAYFGFALNFNIGYDILQSSNARIILGSNNYFSMRFFDEIKNPSRKSDNIMGFVISPNVLGEVSLFNNWLAFAGATHALNLIAGNNDKDNRTSYLDIVHTDGTDAFAGIRYQKTNWAVEAVISANMFDNPFDGFNGNSMFAGFGGFIYF